MRRVSSVNDVMSRLNEITDCGICKTIFQDPRVLPCIHTYCLRCLQSHGDSLGLRPGQKMSCPLCRDEFLIPENGLKGLQKNFFMSNLIEMRLIANPVDRNKVCEVCHDSGEVCHCPLTNSRRQNGSLHVQNGMDKIRTKWYGQKGMDKMVAYGQKGMDKIRTKWYWTKWYGHNGTDKIINQSISPAPTDNDFHQSHFHFKSFKFPLCVYHLFVTFGYRTK